MISGWRKDYKQEPGRFDSSLKVVLYVYTLCKNFSELFVKTFFSDERKL